MGNNGKHRSNNKEPLKRGSLDTLARSGTDCPNDSLKGDCSCSGDTEDLNLNQSTKVDDRQPLRNRAKRKKLSRALSLSLVDAGLHEYDYLVNIALESEDFDALSQIVLENKKTQKAFWNMFYCASTLERNGGKITARYCKNRLCLVCNSIRQAQSMNQYKSTLDSWQGDSYMVTLTKPTVKAEDLKDTIHFLLDNFTTIRLRMKQQHKRGQRDKFIGIRKLECTYNPITNLYHPHFHIIVKGKKNAEDLKDYWLKSVKKFGANSKGQNIKKCDGNVSKELFKYITKVVASTSKTNTKGLIYPVALLQVYKAIRGKYTFRNFGFTLPKVEEVKNAEVLEAPLVEDGETTTEIYEWSQKKGDWISTDTNRQLAFFTDSKKFKEDVLTQLNEIESRIVKPKKLE